MENADPKTVLGHLSSAVGHHVINAFSTIVSQGEILRSLTGPWEQEPGEFHDRIEAIIQTALDASVLTRRLIEISHGFTTVETGQPDGPPEVIYLDQPDRVWIVVSDRTNHPSRFTFHVSRITRHASRITL